MPGDAEEAALEPYQESASPDLANHHVRSGVDAIREYRIVPQIVPLGAGAGAQVDLDVVEVDLKC